jgi:electron transport complex protein RnfD
MNALLIASTSPHIRRRETTSSIMRDVLIALLPALWVALYFFRFHALSVIFFSILSCVATEYFMNKIRNKPNTLGDLSAVLTGLLLAFCLPPAFPWWMTMFGGAFAIGIVKQLFGGLGHNFMNPALAGRAFLMASWPSAMTRWVAPGLAAVTTATPLALIKPGTEVMGTLPSIGNLFWGNIGGSIGETSACALLIGAAYLLYRKIITWHIPVAFIGTTALLGWILGGANGLFSGNWLYHIFAGGLILGAFFMATDYTTSPVTAQGKLLMGLGCGCLTIIIRLYGGYPEGVAYSILLMNLLVPMIDRYWIPKRFGEVR